GARSVSRIARKQPAHSRSGHSGGSGKQRPGGERIRPSSGLVSARQRRTAWVLVDENGWDARPGSRSRPQGERSRRGLDATAGGIRIVDRGWLALHWIEPRLLG